MPWPWRGRDNRGTAAAALDSSWSEVRRMIEGAAVFGRLRDEGGEVVGWWPTTSDDVDTAGRHVRLYHKTFDPLTKGEADGLGGGWLEHGLPAVLHTFLTTARFSKRFADCRFRQ